MLWASGILEVLVLVFLATNALYADDSTGITRILDMVIVFIGVSIGILIWVKSRERNRRSDDSRDGNDDNGNMPEDDKPIPQPKQFEREHRDKIESILAGKADVSSLGIQGYFNDLIKQANLPTEWKRELRDSWNNNAGSNAEKLVAWALDRGGNTDDARYTTLGSFLEVLLPTLGTEDCEWLVKTIIDYQLYRDDELIKGLTEKYKIS